MRLRVPRPDGTEPERTDPSPIRGITNFVTAEFGVGPGGLLAFSVSVGEPRDRRQ